MRETTTLEKGPCPVCGAPASEWVITKDERAIGTFKEITCGKCGHSEALLIVQERRKKPR
jgi:hypothetical protein